MTQTTGTGIITTRSTFEIRDRARAALAAGNVYTYQGPGGDEVRIMYAAGGAFVTVDAHDMTQRLTLTKTLIVTSLDQQLKLFSATVLHHSARRATGSGPYAYGRSHGYHAGVIASIAVLDIRIKQLNEVAGVGGIAAAEQVAELRRTRRALRDLLDTVPTPEYDPAAAADVQAEA